MSFISVEGFDFPIVTSSIQANTINTNDLVVNSNIAGENTRLTMVGPTLTIASPTFPSNLLQFNTSTGTASANKLDTNDLVVNSNVAGENIRLTMVGSVLTIASPLFPSNFLQFDTGTAQLTTNTYITSDLMLQDQVVAGGKCNVSYTSGEFVIASPDQPLTNLAWVASTSQIQTVGVNLAGAPFNPLAPAFWMPISVNGSPFFLPLYA